MAPPTGRKQVKLNALMFAMMLEELLSGPCTAKALADHTGMSLLTVNRTIRAMRRRNVVHVAAWERDINGRMTIRVFALGEGRDVKPQISKRSQMNKVYAQRRAARAVGEALGVGA